MSDPAGEHQGTPEYAVYPPRSLRATPVPQPPRDPPPAFEEGSSRGTGAVQLRGGPAGTDRPYDEGRVGQQQPYVYQSSYRTNVGSTEPALYASAGPSTAPHPSSGPAQSHSYPPQTTTRLPPVRALEQEAGISSAGPSSRYQGYRPEEYRNPWTFSQMPSEREGQLSYWPSEQWGGPHRQEQQLRLDAALQELTARSHEPWVGIPRRRDLEAQEHRRTPIPHRTCQICFV